MGARKMEYEVAPFMSVPQTAERVLHHSQLRCAESDTLATRAATKLSHPRTKIHSIIMFHAV